MKHNETDNELSRLKSKLRDVENMANSIDQNSIITLQTAVNNQAEAVLDLRNTTTIQAEDIAEITDTLATLDSSINTLEVGAVNQAEIVSGHSGTISSLQNSVSEHSTAITTLESDVYNNTRNINTLDISLTTLSGSVSEHSTAITTLESDVYDNTTNITSINTTINTLSGTVNSQASTVAGFSSSITNLQSANTALTNATTNHESRIIALENSSGIGTNTILPSYYGTSVDEITALESEVLYKETFTHNGGSLKFALGIRCASDLFSMIFTRINPILDNHYVAEIRIYLSNIPAGLTSTTLDFYINGEVESKTLNFTSNGEEYSLVIPLDYYATTISNNFKIIFTDTTLADTILQHLEIVCTNGANFLCLNRYQDVWLWFTQTRGGNDYIYLNGKKNPTCGFYVYQNYLNISSSFKLSNHLTTTYNGITENNKYTKVYQRFGYNTSTNQFSGYVSHHTSCITESNNLYYYYKLINEPVYYITNNVYDAEAIFTAEDLGRHLSGVRYDGSVFMGKDSTEVLTEPTLNLVNLPHEFICCKPVEDNFLAQRISPTYNGYILLHKTGNLIFVPNKNSTYFIKLGTGKQVNAYLQQDLSSIHIYYNYNSKVIKRVLVFNTILNKWTLNGTIEVKDCEEYFEYREGVSYYLPRNYNGDFVRE